MNVDAHNTAAKKFWRTLIVVLLAGFVLGMTQPNIIAAIAGLSEGTYGMAFDHTGLVTAVVPGLPAARAGIGPGDRIETVSMLDRVTAYESSITIPGTPLHLVVHHGDQARAVTLSSDAADKASTIIQTIIKRLTSLAFVLVGAGLLLLRPSRMTWGLFLFALSANGTAGALYYHIFGIKVFLPIELVLNLIGTVGVLGLWIFAARFPYDEAPGWRAFFDRAAPWLAIPLLAGFYPFWNFLYTGQPYSSFAYYYGAYVGVVIETVGVLILVATYIHERGEAKQRIKWVVAGFAVGYITDGVITILSDPHVHVWPAAWLPNLTPDVLYFFWIVTPISIAYAVLRHRVIDVRFAVSRAIVYATLTSLVVAAFAFIDWFFTEKMSAAQLGSVAEIGAAVAVGFWFKTVHRRIDLFIDGVLFRRRHLAERRLALAASALPHAASLSSAAELLTAEPVHAFELTSGAVFMRTEDESFRRVFSIGWSEQCLAELPNDDLLLARLRASREVLSLHDLYWPAMAHCPQSAGAPIIAIPVVIRSQLAAIVLLGPHTSGEAFDPDELRSLNTLCVGASAAFDHLESEQRRAENESLRKIVDQLTGRTSVTGIARA
ncbi:MAG: GAF domain-containing protein [Candidatus Eremiobacteraeota bacterium]|nr:GAF domain-containing protein [Candidatus Eremiobacteraeota bacterium]